MEIRGTCATMPCMMYRLRKFILILCLLGFGLGALEASPLPASEAFPISVEQLDEQRIEVLWDLPAGYYLYHRFKLTSERDDWSVAYWQMQPSAYEQPSVADAQELLYRGRVKLEIVLGQTTPGEGELSVAFQGCSDEGFCYPPMERQILLQISQSKGVVQATLSPLSEQKSEAALELSQLSSNMTFFMYFVAGILLAFTPCSLPMVPILSSLIIDQGQHPSTWSRGLRLSMAYVMGMALTYAGLGMLSGYLGSYLALSFQHPFWLMLMTFILILLAWSLVGRMTLALPTVWSALIQRLSQALSGGQYSSVFLMGSMATLLLSPCITPPLIAAISYIGHTGDVWQGGASLFCLGLGMGMPLLLFGASLNHWLPKSGAWMHNINILLAFSILAVVVELWVAMSPFWVNKLLWALWWFSFSCYFVFVIGKAIQNTSRRYVCYAFGFILCLSSISWHFQSLRYHSITKAHTMVKDLASLNEHLQQAKVDHKRVFIDYTAQWCANCRWFEAQVWPEPQVQHALNTWHVIKIDLTEQNQQTQSLMSRFHVMAPPTYLWLDAKGEVLHRHVGKLASDEFVSRLNQFN